MGQVEQGGGTCSVKRVTITRVEVEIRAQQLRELANVAEDFKLDEVCWLNEDVVKVNFYKSHVEGK